MSWNLNFITEKQLQEHVEATIKQYGKKLQSFDLKEFNSNLIDPIKLLFDKSVYKVSWEEIINSEIIRQRDKSNTNDIGYFHQKIFSYFTYCEVPDKGWDVIYRNPEGINLTDGDKVKTIYVEMKNKHNTMNSASAAKTYMKMQNQLLKDDDCACYLVEAIASKSQNIKWMTTVDGSKVNHKRIRRVSMDQFYGLVTGDEKAFYKLCMKLPETIERIVNKEKDVLIPKDTVISELEHVSTLFNSVPEDTTMAMAVYMLGFSSYAGFVDSVTQALNHDMSLKRIYEYGKQLNSFHD